MQLPKRYIDDVRATPGVEAATWANWFAAKDPKQRTQFFAGFAADHQSWFNVMNDMKVDQAALDAWNTTPNGAILGDVLAKTLEVEVGGKVTINSDIYPGDWEFVVVGIYTPLRKSVDRNSMVFRWDYLNNDKRAVYSHEQIGWVMSRITDSSKSAEISKAIDQKFDEKDDQTVTMSERAFQLSFLGGFSAVLKAFDLVSLVILLIMTLILGNTIAMSVRERTHEYGVLRAIGFPPSHILGFILGESLLVAFVGGLLGIGLVQLVLNMMIGPALEANGGMFAYFHASGSVLLMGLGIAALLGVVAGVIPAILASRLKVTDALRRLD
jgi:putative ABC transport system permease protein